MLFRSSACSRASGRRNRRGAADRAGQHDPTSRWQPSQSRHLSPGEKKAFGRWKAPDSLSGIAAQVDLDRSVDAEVDPASESRAAVTGVWGREIVPSARRRQCVRASRVKADETDADQSAPLASKEARTRIARSVRGSVEKTLQTLSSRSSPERRKGDEDVRSRRSARGSRDTRARGSSRPLAAKDRSDVRGTPALKCRLAEADRRTTDRRFPNRVGITIRSGPRHGSRR